MSVEDIFTKVFDRAFDSSSTYLVGVPVCEKDRYVWDDGEYTDCSRCGRICPRCGSVYAPRISKCDTCNPHISFHDGDPKWEPSNVQRKRHWVEW